MWRPILLVFMELFVTYMLFNGNLRTPIQMIFQFAWILFLIMIPLSIIREIRTGGRDAWGPGDFFPSGSSSREDDDRDDDRKPEFIWALFGGLMDNLLGRSEEDDEED